MKQSASQNLKIQDYVDFWQSLCPGIKVVAAALWFWEEKIKQILKKKKEIKALVLGVTPEIRDLLAEYNIDTVCLDNNSLMAKAMDRLVKKKNLKEKIIIGDWLNMPFPEKHFDLIISDCPQDNLPYGKFDLLFENIYKVLKSKGYLMLGTTYFKGFKEAISLKQYIAIYRRKPKAFQDLTCKYYYLMKLSGCEDYYDPETKVSDWLKIDADLKELFKKEKINQEEFSALRIATEKLDISLACKWTWATLDDFIKLFSKHNFNILGLFEDDATLGDYFRQAWILKKKSYEENTRKEN